MSKIEDPRHASYVKYPLPDILIIVMCAVLCGIDTLGDLVIYAENKQGFFEERVGYSKHSVQGNLWQEFDIDIC